MKLPKRPVVTILFLGLLAAALVTAQGKQTFKGTITDDMCPRADHSQMRMGPTDAECSAACIDEHGAAYILFDGDGSYQLSDQKAAQKFVSRKVKVVGTLDGKTRTIHVESIAPAE